MQTLSTPPRSTVPTTAERSRLIGAVERHVDDDRHEMPDTRFRVVDEHLGRVLVSWGAPGTWAAWLFAVSPNGTCWIRGFGLGCETRQAAEKEALDCEASISAEVDA